MLVLKITEFMTWGIAGVVTLQSKEIPRIAYIAVWVCLVLHCIVDIVKVVN